MTVDLHRMRQFVAVAETLHFGRAATRLGMAQPPLSQSIRRLEAALGVSLLERSNRKVEMTAAGRVFLQEARCTLQQADEAVRMTRRAGSGDLADISVSFVSAALYRVLPAALREFRGRFPKTHIRLDERSTDAQLMALHGGETDVGFVHPPIGDAKGLTVMVIDRDPFVAAVPTFGRLSSRAALRLADLAAEPFVLFPHRLGPNLHGKIVAACRQAGFLPRITQEAPRMHTILSLVAAGLGVSLVQASARSCRVDGVAFVPVEDMPDDLRWELALAWQPNRATRALREFVAMVGQVAENGRVGATPAPQGA